MDSLAKKLSRREVRAALDSLPKELDETYDQAMQRIQNQDEGQTALAHKVLYWISCSLRPLTVAELRHALAVEPGDCDLDEDGLYETELLVSVCAGLVNCGRGEPTDSPGALHDPRLFQAGWNSPIERSALNNR